jgi:ribosomal protein S18 acetylase RimI-like enzyme
MPLTVEFELRPARLEDIESILKLWCSMMAEHERADDRVRLAEGAQSAYRAYLGYHITSREAWVRVAEVDRRMIGFCLLIVNRNLPMFLPPRYGYLSDLAIDPKYRRQGIGREIVRAGSEWLRRQDIHSIQLQYYQFNENGRKFWEELGFKPYYTRMWLDLEPSSKVFGE